MRVLVCGGRSYGVGQDKDDEKLEVKRVLDELHDAYPITCIIEGGAPGADALGRAWGEHNGIPVETYKADWNAFGQAAGPIRNREMINKGKPNIVVAFPGGRGTMNMIELTKRAGIELINKAWDIIG